MRWELLFSLYGGLHKEDYHYMRTRPFLLQPIYQGGPLNSLERYFRNELKQYREENKEFDEFLNDIKNVIFARELDYCENILLFIDGEPKVNWVCTKNSLFSIFVKLFNYDFSAEQAVNHICECYQVYKHIMTTEYKLDKEYKIYQKKTRWDGSTRDYININLTPNDQLDNGDYYWVNVDFCSLQDSNQNKEHLCDTEINIRCGRDIFNDALALFNNYQNGNPLNQKILAVLIKGLLNRRIIRKPIKMDYGHSMMDFYIINE